LLAAQVMYRCLNLSPPPTTPPTPVPDPGPPPGPDASDALKKRYAARVAAHNDYLNNLNKPPQPLPPLPPEECPPLKGDSDRQRL
jgi:hypothetical protein